MPLDVEHVWYDTMPPPLWLRALVPVYRGLRALHRASYGFGLRQPTALPVPVIVVGNLTVGGTGKTPLVIALVEALRARGLKPGVVSRGYGGRVRRALLLDDLADPQHFGDEPCLIRRRTGAAVAVGANRVAAARLLVERGVSAIIADDGLQNPALARDVEICVIDGDRRFGNGHLLPAGPLREPLSRLDGIALRVCNGGEPGPGETSMRLAGDMAVAVAGDPAARPLAGFAGQRVHAVAGIGHPARFFVGLRARGIEVIEHAFPDHHAFRAEDLAFGDDRPVLMTEKDAVKCVRFAATGHWCVPVRAELPAAFFDSVAVRLSRN